MHKSQGCCGEEQRILCTAKSTPFVLISIGNLTYPVFGNTDPRNIANNITIRLVEVTPTDVPGLMDFYIAVEYAGSEVNDNMFVNCSTTRLSDAMTVTLNSK